MSLSETERSLLEKVAVRSIKAEHSLDPDHKGKKPLPVINPEIIQQAQEIPRKANEINILTEEQQQMLKKMATLRSLLKEKVLDDKKAKLESSNINVLRTRVFKTDRGILTIACVFPKDDLSDPFTNTHFRTIVRFRPFQQLGVDISSVIFKGGYFHIDSRQLEPPCNEETHLIQSYPDVKSLHLNTPAVVQRIEELSNLYLQSTTVKSPNLFSKIIRLLKLNR